MAGTVVADTLRADSTSTLVIKNGVANTPPTVQDSAGTEIGTFCRAWINFDGTAVTNPASMTGVRGSFNVSSVLDNGTGDYTVNFTTAMPDANYSVVHGSNVPGTGSIALRNLQTDTLATGNVRFGSYVYTGSSNTQGREDRNVHLAIFR